MIIGSNFRLNSRKFLDARQQCESLEKLNANEESILYPYGFEVFCVEEGKWYQNVSEDNIPIWEQRKGGVGGSNGEINIDDIIEDGEVLSDKTWSSEYINGFKINLEQSITDIEDYVAEIEDRVIYIEGQLQWFETFDGSYNSLTDKPIIPSKISDLENDSDFVTIDDVSEVIDALHTHENLEILNDITEEKISLWDNMVGSAFNGDYNFLENKPIEYIGDDSEIKLNLNNITSGNYIVTNTIDDIQLINELVIIDKKENEMLIIIPKLLIKIIYILNNGEWVKQEKINYQVDKDNANISNSLNIGTNNIVGENNQIVQGKYNVEDTEGKYINIVGNGEDEKNRRNVYTLDWEGNAWYNGKVSQEGTPTEDKDLVTKGYVDGKFATSECVEKYIEDNNKENARRDVIIDALANGRRRTIDYVDGEADLFYATEKDNIFIDKIEGETLVNVCDQEEPIAITKSYTVENTNHVALQGEYDGKCRPVVYGNTLVNRNVEYDKSMIIGNVINESGTEVNIIGTANSEVEVSLDGHTALNLGTKKGGELCKSFESASGNEIKLTTDRNSKTDVVCQGNTLVNIGIDSQSYTYLSYESNIRSRRIMLAYPVDKITIISNYSGTQLKYQINYDDENETISSSNHQSPFVAFKEGFKIKSILVYIANADFVEGAKTEIHNLMIFEGDLTQTPELIPTEYVEGIQSTFEDKYIPYSIYNGDNLTSITETQYQLPLTVKTNATYTVVTTINTTKYQYAIYSQDSLSEYLAYENTLSTATFSSDKANISFKVRMNPLYEGEDYNFVLDEVKDKFLIVEGNWQGRENLLTSEYFGKYKVDMRSVGKNLFDINKVHKSDNYIINGNTIKRVTSKGYYQSILTDVEGSSSKQDVTKLIKLNKGTYYFGSKSITGSNPSISIEGLRVRFHKTDGTIVDVDESGDYLLPALSNRTIKLPYSFTLLQDLYIDLVVAQTGDCVIEEVQIEEGTVATEYEPYCGTTKTIYLNSPLYEGDELLTKDGKIYHYHKMGSVVLDGSEDWSVVDNTSDTIRFITRNITFSSPGDEKIRNVCNRFKCICFNDRLTQEPYCYTHNEEIVIRILSSKLSTTDANGFKQWLSENPTTVVYELAEPYYEEISTTDDMIFDIATSSTLSYESAVPMDTTSFLPYINELPLLETSTQYRVSFDCDVVGLPLVISLGGTTTTITSELHNTLSIITPSIETDGKLTIDGSGMVNIDNVVVTKGEMEYEYFEGLKSSFEDRYVNLWDGTYIKAYINSQGVLIVQNAETYTTNWMPCKPNTTYSIQGGDRNRWLMRNSLGELTFIGGTIGDETPTIRTLNDTIELCCYYRVDTSELDINTVHQNLVIWESNDMTYEEALTNKNKYKTKITLTNNNNNLIFGKGGRL